MLPLESRKSLGPVEAFQIATGSAARSNLFDSKKMLPKLNSHPACV